MEPNSSSGRQCGVVLFEPNGPGNAGLEEWFSIDPSTLMAGHPVQKVHIYHEEKKFGYLTGVWDCTPMTEHFGRYPVHEFMILLEGSLTLVLADNTIVEIGKHEPFVIPKGLQCQWLQTEYVRKYFMIFENPDTPPAAENDEQSIILPVGNFLEHVPTELSSRGVRTDFRDPSGQMVVSSWLCEAGKSISVPSDRNELIYVVDGSMVLVEPGKTELPLGQGDVAYVRQGTACSAYSEGGVKAISSCFTCQV